MRTPSWGPDGAPHAPPPLAAAPLAIGLAALAAVLTCAAAGPSGYGYHRDELYFLAAGRRPAWGYPDQPPLTPLLARLTEVVAPHSPIALRVPAILAAVAVTLLTALLAREFGGGTFAQLTAALAIGSGVFTLLSGHLLLTSTADLALQTLLVWLVVRALRTGRQRLWIAAGLVLGVGLLNKQLPLFLAAALTVGVALTPQARPALRRPGPYLAAVIAAAAWVPVLWWQAAHGWPQLTLAAQIRAEFGRPGERIAFVAIQFVLFGVGSAVLWVLGAIHLFRSPALRPFRYLAWAWLALMAVFAVTAGQVYYAAAVYPALAAAGAVAAERWRPRLRTLLVAWTSVGALVMLPASLPVLTPSTLDASVWSGLGEQLRETVGWPALVRQVAAVRAALPPDRRAGAVVVTANYGEAGAAEEYGPALGVPRPAYSGHNGFAAWGPPPDGAGPVILVWQGDPSPWFTGCAPQGRVVTGIHNEEGDEAAVHLCTGPVGGWRTVWPRLTRLRA